MFVVTVVEGNVPSLKAKVFEENFAMVKTEPVPQGFVSSSLLRGSKEPEVYRIQTVWQSREALEKMRSSTQTPKAFELFQKVGVKPTLEVYEVIDSVP